MGGGEDRAGDVLDGERRLQRMTPRDWKMHPVRRLLGLAIGLAVLLAGPPAPASVETELSYHRGVIAYGEGRLEEARVLFEKVLAEDPEDKATLQYLALIAQGLGELEASIGYFERAVAADPDDIDPRFGLGMVLLRVERSAEARAQFEKILALDPSNAQAELYAGIAAYRLQDYDAVVAHMKRAVELDDSVRMQARYYVGLAEAFQGNLSASSAAFSDAATVNPSDPLAQSAQALADAIEPLERRWAFDASMGMAYDSNPTYVGDTNLVTESGQPIRREPDYLGAFRVNALYDLVEHEQLDLRAGYNGFFSLHKDEKIVDQQTHVGWLSGSWTQDILLFGLRYDFAYTDLDRTSEFRRLHRAAGNFAVQESIGVTQLVYEYQNRAFFYAVPLPKLDPLRDVDPDGNFHDVSVTQFFFTPRPWSYARLGFAYEHSDTEGTEYDFDGYEANAGFGAQLPLAGRMAVLYRYIRRNYQNISWFEPKVRDDHVHRLNVDFTVPFEKYWEFTVRGSFNFFDSNIEAYDFNRHIVGTYVKFIY